jgi:hypothetical protein
MVLLLPKTNYRNQYGWFGVETDKYPNLFDNFKFAERLAVSTVILVADSLGIQTFWKKNIKKNLLI